jgi:hypothetical protein
VNNIVYLPLNQYPDIQEVKLKKLLLGYITQLRLKIYASIFKKLSDFKNYEASFAELDNIQSELDAIQAFAQVDNNIIIDSIQLALFLSNKTLNRLTLFTKENNNLSKISISDSELILNKIVRSWAITNSKLIKSIPQNLLNDVSRIIYTGFQENWTVTKIKFELKNTFDITESRAALIARNEISKLNTALVRYEHKALGIKNYVWISRKDNKVRQSHAVLDNKVCSWVNPNIFKNSIKDKWLKKSSIGGDQKQVGEAFGCRCEAKGIIT